MATDDPEVYYRVLLHGQYNKRCRREIPDDHQLAPYAVTGMGLKHDAHEWADRASQGKVSSAVRTVLEAQRTRAA